MVGCSCGARIESMEIHTDGESHAVGGDVLESLMISAVDQNHYCGSFHALSSRNFGPEKLSNHSYILLVFFF